MKPKVIAQTTAREVAPDITVIAVTGRLNLGPTLIAMEEALKKRIEDGSRKLVLDLTGLSYIDSSGIGAIVMYAGRMKQAGGRMRVAGAQGVVARAFEIVRLSVVVPQDSNVAAACAALA